jgi:hypothetical protein
MGGVTGWNFTIMRHERYAHKISNYCASLWVGHFLLRLTSELFYTDDNGTYIFPTRDFHPEIEIYDGKVDLEELLSVHKKRTRKLSDKRLHIPRSEPYMEGSPFSIQNFYNKDVNNIQKCLVRQSVSYVEIVLDLH